MAVMGLAAAPVGASARSIGWLPSLAWGPFHTLTQFLLRATLVLLVQQNSLQFLNEPADDFAQIKKEYDFIIGESQLVAPKLQA